MPMGAGRQEIRPLARRRLRPALPPALAVRCRAFAAAIGIWAERFRTRRRLTQLSDHILKDIGVSRAEVALEAHKPFWRR